MTRNKHLSRAVAAAAVAVLLFAACGGSDDDGAADASGGGDDGEAKGTPVAVLVGETDVNNQYMTVDPGSVSAGLVTFTVTNEGAKEHEFEVFATDVLGDAFEIGDDDKIIDPEGAEELEEIEDIEGGDSATVTLDLEPGHYVFVCNIEGHYRMGMHSDFTVE